MEITLVGTLPVSTLNIGLAAAPAAFDAKVQAIAADIAKFTASVDLQLLMQSSFPPDLVSFTTAFTLAFDPTGLAQLLNPTAWAIASADANAQLTADGVLIAGLLETLEPIVADLQAGVSTGGLVGWTYAGRAAGYGTTLRGATVNGYGGIGPTQIVDAIIIATAQHGSWQAFGEGFEVGASADEDLGETSSIELLTYHGTLSGGAWNKGVTLVLQSLLDLLSEMQGLQAVLEAQLELSLGIGLPDAAVIVDAGLELDLDVAFENLVEVQADLTADISVLQVKIDATLDIIARIEAQLAAGGLTCWRYRGPAGELGVALETELANGLPGTATGPDGATYGLVVASSSPDAWTSFGRIFFT